MSGDLRRTIHSAYTFIRSMETNKAIASLTMDHMVQGQIARLKKGSKRTYLDGAGNEVASVTSEGNDDGVIGRSSRYDQLVELQASVESAVQQIIDAGNDVEKLENLGIRLPESLDAFTQSRS